MALLIGLDVGGTKTSIVLSNEKFEIEKEERFETMPQRGFENFFEELVERIKRILDGRSPDGIGVSIGGPLDSKEGIIFNPPHLRWGEVRIKDRIMDTFKVPVRIEHDAKAGALAEWRFGAGRGSRNMIFLTLGTGLGAGMILNGRLYRGTNDSAGEVGHMRVSKEGPVVYGKAGSWESFCSGKGISKLAHHMFPDVFDEKIDTKEISRLAFEGNEYAVKVLKESGKYLGIGMSILIDVLNPDTIVLGNLSWRLPNFWLGEALKVMEEETLEATRRSCRIRRNELKDRLGDISALIVAESAWKGIDY